MTGRGPGGLVSQGWCTAPSRPCKAIWGGGPPNGGLAPPAPPRTTLTYLRAPRSPRPELPHGRPGREGQGQRHLLRLALLQRVGRGRDVAGENEVAAVAEDPDLEVGHGPAGNKSRAEEPEAAGPLRGAADVDALANCRIDGELTEVVAVRIGHLPVQVLRMRDLEDPVAIPHAGPRGLLIPDVPPAGEGGDGDAQELGHVRTTL